MNDIELERKAVGAIYKMLRDIAGAVVRDGTAHQPMLITLGKSNEGDPTTMEATSLAQIDKRLWPAIITGLIVGGETGVAVLMTEAWTTTIDEDDARREALTSGEMAVSELPESERREALVMQFTTCTQNVWVAICPIDRNDDGSRTLREAPLILAGEDAQTQFSGRLMPNTGSPSGVTRH